MNWSSSNASIATINYTDKKGLATGITVGTTTITASGSANGTPFSATAELTVTDATVTELQVAPVTPTIAAGLAQQFTAIATLSDGSTLDVTSYTGLNWTTSDPAIATVSSLAGSKGLATGVIPGAVTITASGSANSTLFSATAQLTVPPLPNFGAGCALGYGTVTAGGLTYTCPLTQEEADAYGISYTATYSENGFTYVRHDWGSADAYCAGLGSGFRLPTSVELTNLYSTYGDMGAAAGWPTDYFYGSSTAYNANHHYMFDLEYGDAHPTLDSNKNYVSCVRSGS